MSAPAAAVAPPLRPGISTAPTAQDIDRAKAVLDNTKPAFKLGAFSTFLTLTLIVVALAFPPIGLPKVASSLLLIVIAAIRVVVGVGISALIAYAAYFCCFRAPRIGASVYCVLISLQILGVIFTSPRFAPDSLTARDSQTQRLLEEVDRQRDQAIAAIMKPVAASHPSDSATKPAPPPPSAAPTTAPAKKGEPFVRVYRKP